MEFVLVSFPQPRTVRSGGNAIGSTNQLLAINGGTHTFTLSDPQDYVPPSQRLVVAGTSVATPLNVIFTPAETILRTKFPAEVFTAANHATAVDPFIAQLAPLGLNWQVEKSGAFGATRAQAVYDQNPQTGEAWIIAALDAATFAPHRHNSGGQYGELLLTLAGELNDPTAVGGATLLGPGTITLHAPDTVHAPSSAGFWVGIYHQPRGATAIV